MDIHGRHRLVGAHALVQNVKFSNLLVAVGFGFLIFMIMLRITGSHSCRYTRFFFYDFFLVAVCCHKRDHELESNLFISGRSTFPKKEGDLVVGLELFLY